MGSERVIALVVLGITALFTLGMWFMILGEAEIAFESGNLPTGGSLMVKAVVWVIFPIFCTIWFSIMTYRAIGVRFVWKKKGINDVRENR